MAQLSCWTVGAAYAGDKDALYDFSFSPHAVIQTLSIRQVGEVFSFLCLW